MERQTEDRNEESRSQKGPLSFSRFNNKWIWYDHEALSPHSLQKWFNTFINGKLILFDVPDNGGKKWNKFVLRKRLCDCVLHCQTESAYACCLEPLILHSNVAMGGKI